MRGVDDGFEPETTALIARMAVAPTPERATAMDVLIQGLKGAQVWDKLDILHVEAAHTAQAAGLNWVSNNFTLTPVNAPEFVVDRGYRSDGSSSYLLTGFNPAIAGKLVQNSAHLGVWIASEGAESGQDFGSVNPLYIISRSATNTLLARINQASSLSASGITTALGYSAGSRLGQNDMSIYKNGEMLAQTNLVSTAVSSTELRVCRATAYATKRVAITHAGSGLTAEDVQNLHSLFETYLAKVGVIA